MIVTKMALPADANDMLRGDRTRSPINANRRLPGFGPRPHVTASMALTG